MNYLLWGSLSPPPVRQPYHLAGGAGPPGADRRLPQGAPVGSEALERWVTEPADGRDRRTTPPRVAAQGRPDRRHRRRALLGLALHVHGGRQATSRRRSKRPAGIFVPSGSDREVAKASPRQSSALTAARASLKVGARFGYQ